jgi:hypothetical protein
MVVELRYIAVYTRLDYKCRRCSGREQEPLPAVGEAQQTFLSVANVNSIKSGQVESGFAQFDVTYWAYAGTGPFVGKQPVKKLCVISSLFPEHLHVVSAVDSGIKTVLGGLSGYYRLSDYRFLESTQPPHHQSAGDDLSAVRAGAGHAVARVAGAARRRRIHPSERLGDRPSTALTIRQAASAPASPPLRRHCPIGHTLVHRKHFRSNGRHL